MASSLVVCEQWVIRFAVGGGLEIGGLLVGKEFGGLDGGDADGPCGRDYDCADVVFWHGFFSPEEFLDDGDEEG